MAVAQSSLQAYRLPNDMLVLLKEDHHAPITTCWVWYRVGSRNEPDGLRGITHWVEHMLFKGTPTIPGDQIDYLVARNGGNFNAFTWIDYTAYHTTLPSDRIETILHLEADRMMNAIFDPEEVERERTVILSELDGYTSMPSTWLDEAVMSAGYRIHPYRHPVLGYKSDLQAITRDDLYNYYQTYYKPNNAVLVIVGDIDVAQIKEMVDRHFAQLPRGLPIPTQRLFEAEPFGLRSTRVDRPGTTAYVQVSWLATHSRHPDYTALYALDVILGGIKGMSGRTSRLYRALVETTIASDISTNFPATHDDGLFETYATIRPEHTPEEAVAIIRQVVEDIRANGITPEELTRAQKQMRALLAYESEGVGEQARALGQWEVLDSYERVNRLAEEISSVTIADVQRVAQTWLTDTRCVIGMFVPKATDTGVTP